MRVLPILIAFLALTSIVVAQTPSPKDHKPHDFKSDKAVVEFATKDSVELLKKYQAELDRCIKQDVRCELEISLKKKVKKQKKVVKEKKRESSLNLRKLMSKLRRLKSKSNLKKKRRKTREMKRRLRK